MGNHRPADSQWPPYDESAGQGASGHRQGGRHRGTPGPGHPPRRATPPAEPIDDPSWLPALTWTISCFVVPVVLYLVWAATRSGVPPPDCFDDGGAACPAPRSAALHGLMDMAPGLAGAVALAVLSAVGLRFMIEEWPASTVGVSAAVIGAGMATMIATVLG